MCISTIVWQIIPVGSVYLVGGKDSEQCPSFESFERREAIVERLEDSLFAGLVSLHALDLLLVQSSPRPTDDRTMLLSRTSH